MLRGLFDGPGIWIVLIVVLLLFGATRLPALARSLGQSTKILRDEMKTDKKTDAPTPDAAASAAVPLTVVEPVVPAPAAATAAEPAAPTKSAKSSKTASGKSGKTAKS
jgi:sec-independent protein translocase protein TatA